MSFDWIASAFGIVIAFDGVVTARMPHAAVVKQLSMNAFLENADREFDSAGRQQLILNPPAQKNIGLLCNCLASCRGRTEQDDVQKAETTEGKHGIMMNAKNCISRLPVHMSKRIILDRLEKPGVQKMSCATDIFNMQYRFQISAHVVFIIIFLFIVVIVVVGIDRRSA